MLVKDYMTRHPLMAAPTMPIVEAQRYMGENNIRHLPVVGDGKRLLGSGHQAVTAGAAGDVGEPERLGDHPLPVQSDRRRRDGQKSKTSSP